jgi:type II secretory pathway component PulM
MSMFDGLLGNLDDIAAKIGLPADQVQALVQSVQGKMASGGDMMSAVTAAAQEHGISLERLQGLIAGSGVQDMLGKVTGALDKDGDGNPLNDLGGLAKGLFGKD